MTKGKKIISLRDKKRSSYKKTVWNGAKTETYNNLVSELQNKGFTVRREELKRGYGWKALSGSCRSYETKMIFVDSRLSPDEQIEFLRTKVAV